MLVIVNKLSSVLLKLKLYAGLQYGQCCPLGDHKRFGRTCCLHFHGTGEQSLHHRSKGVDGFGQEEDDWLITTKAGAGKKEHCPRKWETGTSKHSFWG